VEVFPFTSVTVKVTVFGPTFAQVNDEGETLIVAIPQASELPLLTCAALIVAVPPLLRFTEIFWQTATGGVTSLTVTTAVQVDTFPFTSVTVSVTVFAPTLEQLNVVGETLTNAIPQLSKLPLLICDDVMLAVPDEFRFTEIFWHIAVGSTLSSTVTVAVQVEEFPLTSVTVNVTVFAPTFEQLNVAGETVIVPIPQASELPLSTSPAAIVTVPAALSWTVIFWQTATGAVLSITVTLAVQVEEFPFTSVTISVTTLLPSLAQVNDEGETESEAIPHASELPLLICVAVMFAVPPADKITLMLWQSAVGGVTSLTVTVAVQVDEFPFTSVTVSVTVFAPIFAQVNDEGETLMLAIPHASELPLLTCATVMVTFPAAFKFTEIF